MSDTLITVIAIALAAVLMFVFPLMTMSDRTDDIAQLAVETATSDFVNKARTTGKVTQAEYDKYVQTITSTGNTYQVSMENIKTDSNLGKKATQERAGKIGEGAQYTEYTSQIEAALESDKNHTYYMNEGDFFTVKAKNTNQTIGQQLASWFYSITGNDSYTIAAQQGGIVTANGK